MNDRNLPLHGDDASAADPIDAARREQQTRALLRSWPKLIGAAALGTAIGYAGSFCFAPTYLSSTLFIPPQQQQGGAASALASLGALSSLIGGAGGLKSSADQYVSMMSSVTISDDIIKRFGLMKVYDVEFMDEARKKLARRALFSMGKKDGLIRVDVEDEDAKRAAAIANGYVDELRVMTSHLAVTEAQQRRVFFERLLNETKQKLALAQGALEGTGYSAGALKAEPKSAAEVYAKLRAELTAAQVKLQVLHGSLADTAPEVQQQTNVVAALSGQLDRLEATQKGESASADYIGKYRDFKYQETLFELYAKQYELARLDEAREGALIQVVDEAQPAERKHFPRRSLFGGVGAAIALFGLGALLWQRAGRAVARSGE